MVIELKSSTIQ